MRRVEHVTLINVPASVLAKRSQGMTLVELLVALTLGLLVIAGIGQIYTAAKRSYDIQTNMSHLQDAGRYAIDTLTRDIQRAGYWGLTDMRTLIANNLNGGEPSPDGTCSSGDSTWGSMVRGRIFGLNDISGPNGSSYQCIGTDWLQSDVLVVRYANPAQPNSCSDTAQYTYIRTKPYSYSVSISVNPGCLSSQAGTTVHRVVARAYYVQKNSQARCNGTTIPSLAMEELTAGGLPIKRDLIVGVENLQFQFGVDTDTPPDGSVNQYLNADQISNDFTITPNWNQVMSVRVWALVRSECPEAGYNNKAQYTLGDNPPFTMNDNYRRQLYSTTISLRN